MKLTLCPEVATLHRDEGKSFECLLYQLSMVGYMPTMVVTGNGELGLDSGEQAWETASTSKEGSRRANYAMTVPCRRSEEK